MNAEVAYIVENWYCCREWPIVVETVTHGKRGLKRERWWVRTCGYCGRRPTPDGILAPER